MQWRRVIDLARFGIGAGGIHGGASTTTIHSCGDSGPFLADRRLSDLSHSVGNHDCHANPAGCGINRCDLDAGSELLSKRSVVRSQDHSAAKEVLAIQRRQESEVTDSAFGFDGAPLDGSHIQVEVPIDLCTECFDH